MMTGRQRRRASAKENMKTRILSLIAGMKRPHMERRIPALWISVLLMGFCVAVFRKIQFGTDPCSTLNLGIADWIGVPFGTTQLMINLVLFAIVVRFDAGRIGMGTIANMCFVGYFTDFFSFLLSFIPALDSLTMTGRIALFVPVMALFMVVASIYMVVDMGVAPYDAIPQIIAKKKNWSFRPVRICWDILHTVGGFMLGSTVGVVTLVVAFGMGPMVTWMAEKVRPIFE